MERKRYGYRGLMNIKYFSGHVKGDYMTENVNISEIKVKNQIIGIAKEVDIPLLENVIWDGMLGLAYSNKNL